MTEKWKRRLTDKLPKMTRKETMVIIILSLLTIVIVFGRFIVTVGKDGLSCNNAGNKIGGKN